MSGPRRVYGVVYATYDIFEIDSLWYSREAADRRCKVLRRQQDYPYEVETYEVEDAPEDES